MKALNFTPNPVIFDYKKPLKVVFDGTSKNVRKESAYYYEIKVIDKDYNQAIVVKYYWYGKYSTTTALWIYNEPIATNTTESNMNIYYLLQKAGYSVEIFMNDIELLKVLCNCLGIEIGCISEAGA